MKKLQDEDFFSTFLEDIRAAFSDGNMCILECKEKESGKIVKVLAKIHINRVSRRIEFLPVATLFDKNPMHGMAMTHGTAVLSSQKSMSEWVKEAEGEPCDVSQMN